MRAPQLTARLGGLLARFDRAAAPGIAVGVAYHGETIYRQAFGLANIEHSVPNTPDTRFRIASVTKQLTCLAALLLAERGKLDIDAGIRAYVPELGQQSGEPTLRQLMNHTSGYRCYIDLGFIADGPAVHPDSHALKLQIGQRRGNFVPGERLLYSNGAYAILSLAIERATAQSFDTVLQELILGPLGMVDTRIASSDFEVHEGLASLYVPDGDRWRHWVFFAEGLRGDGGLISTIDDMLRWLRALREKSVPASAGTWRKLLEPAVLPNGFVSPYALGVEIDSYRGVRVLRHSGGVVGGTSQVMTVPEHELDIVLFTNGAPGHVTEIGFQIIDTVLGSFALKAPTAAPRVERYRELIGEYFCHRTGMLVGIEDLGGAVGISLLGGPPVIADQSTDGLVVPFLRTGAGQYVMRPVHRPGDIHAGLEVSDCGNLDYFVRVEATSSSVTQLVPELPGAFYSPEIDARASFRASEHSFELEIHGPYGYSLWGVRPLTRDILVVRNELFPIWTGVINLKRRDGRVTGFELSTRRTRQLEFEVRRL